jgi:uncharacterized protein (DUF302 family)
MRTIGTYAFETTTRRGFDDAIGRVRELLEAEGFATLADIDVRAALRKPGLDYRPYRILGVSTTSFLHKALAAEPHVGVLLPCNVVVWDEGDHRVIAATEPRVLSAIVDSPEIRMIVAEVSARLHRVLEKVDA